MKVGVLATIAFATLIGFPIASFAGLAPDTDTDGIPDVLDKCVLDSRNAAASCDTDVDGYGNVCDGDFDQNFTVNSVDFGSKFIPAFKGFDPSPWPEGMDMDCNNTVTSTDFGSNFIPQFKGFPVGTPTPGRPGPSGLSCAGTPGCS